MDNHATRKEDILLGQIAVRRRIITAGQLAECLKEQTDEKLGQILLRKRFITEQQLKELLDVQQQGVSTTTLACRKCGNTINLSADSGKVYRCPACLTILVKMQTTHATQVEVPPESVREADIPADVKTALAQNSQIIGKYLLLNKVGEGGCGIVFRAFDLDLERIVALKVLGHSAGVDFQRTRLEAQLVAKLSHAGIPRIFETGFEGDTHFIAMEFIDGKSAADISFEVNEAMRVGRDVALILDYAHAQGTIHRDIKPQNIMLDKSGKVWIMDFGIAKSLNTKGEASLTRTGTVVGTPQFMSPEQALGLHDQIDQRTDVFSLGSTCYFLLTGTPPFAGENIVDLWKEVIRRDPKPIRALNPRVPIEADAIVTKAMDKDKAGRYQSVKELAEDVTHFLNGEPIKARPVSTITRLMKRAKRNKKVVAIATLCAAIVVGGSIFAVREYTLRRGAEESSDKAQEIVQGVIRAVLSDLGNAHEEALRRRRSGESYANLSDIPRRILESATYKQVETRANSDPNFLYSLGKLYRLIGDDETAMGYHARALAVNPSFVQARYELGILQFKDYRRQVQALKAEWLRRNSKHMVARALDDASKGLGFEGESDPADEELEDARAKSTRESAMTNLSGNSGLTALEQTTASAISEMISKRLEAAIDRFKSVLQKDAGFEDAVTFLVDTHVTRRDLRAAIEVLTPAIQADRGNFHFLFRRGMLHHEIGKVKSFTGFDPLSDYESGIADMESAITLRGDYFDALLGKGGIWNDVGLFNMNAGKGAAEAFGDAVKCYDRAVDISRRSYAAHVNRGIAWSNLAQYKHYRGEDPSDEFASASLDYEKAIEIEPRNYDVWLRRGTMWNDWASYDQDVGRDPTAHYDRAIADFEKAIQFNARSYEVWLWVAFFWNNRAHYRINSGKDPAEDFKKAGQYFDKAADLAPTIPDVWLRRGMYRNNLALYKLQNGQDPTAEYSRAIEDYGKAISLNSESFQPLVARGLLLLNFGLYKSRIGKEYSGEFRKSLADLDAAVKMNPQHCLPWHYRGTLHLNMGFAAAFSGQDPGAEFEKAIADLDKALSINKNHIDSYVKRGLAWMNAALAGKSRDASFAKALADFDRVVEMNPNHFEGWKYRGTTRNNMLTADSGGDPSSDALKAIKDFESALKLNPKDSATWAGLGHVYNNWGNYKLMNSADPTEQYEKAISNYGESVKLNSADFEALCSRGQVRINYCLYKKTAGLDPVSDYDLAQRDLESATRISPKYLPAWENLGNLHYNRGLFFERKEEFKKSASDYAAAAASWQKLVSLNPPAAGNLNAAIQACLAKSEELLKRAEKEGDY